MAHSSTIGTDEKGVRAEIDRGLLADALLSSALDCIIVANSHGEIIEFNAAAERTFGYTRADVLGRKMEDTIIPPEHHEAHRNGMERYLAGGRSRVLGRRVELEAQRRDGTVFPIELTITETSLQRQKVFVATLRDITSQKVAAAELHQARASLQAFFDYVPAALYLRDRDDRLVMMNNWGAEFIGRDPASMIGQPMANFREPQNVDRVKAVDENILRTGKPETHEFTYHLPGGDRTGLMTFFPVSNSLGEITHIGGMLLDVTELQKARADLQQAQATLESIFDNIPAELYLRELDGSFVMMNKWGANYYGKEPGQMVGELASAYDTGDEIEVAKRAQAKLLETGKPVTQEYNYTVDGRNVKVQNTIFPVKNAEGKIVRIGGVTTDVTELHHARSQRDEAQFLIQSIFDNAPIELYLRELDGTYTMMNKWGANYVGIEDPADMVGKSFAMFDAAEEVELSWAAQKKMMETGEPVTREFHYSVSGNTKALQNTIFPVKDAAGRIVRIGGVSIDVTALNLAKDQRDEARVLIQSIFDNAPVELYLRELDGRYIMMNKWGASYFGVKPEDLLGGHFVWSYDSEEETKRARKAQETLLETGKPVTREFHQAIGGRRITAQNTIFPIRDSEGRIVRIGGISIDMTDLNHARDQLQRAQENLHQSEKLAALGQLLAGVAHELNNPLAVVLGRAAMLQEKLQETPHAAPLQKLREAADRCARIVRTFLAMARQTGPRREIVEVNDLIDSALEMTTYSLRKHNITWTKSLLDAGQTIEADQDQIVQVLINLILNAQQALLEKPDDRRLDISVSLLPDEKWLSIAVIDNGPGVPAAIVSRIFDPFFTTKSVGEGTGLGLSVCKSMVEAHGGKLILEKTPGGGATFRVSLPLHAASYNPYDGVADPENTVQSKGRFLIIDDEIEIAAILADCLAPLGLESIIVSDGQSALDRLADTTFDGVFCDVSMPGMDGITFYTTLKSRNPILASRLVFVSGDVLHRDWEKLKTTAGRPIIEKPFDPQQIRDEALRMLQQKEALP